MIVNAEKWPTELPDEIKSDVAFVNGNTYPRLGEQVANLLGIEAIPMQYKRFADTETYVRIGKNVRDLQVIAFQTHAPVHGYSTADSFYQHLQMIDASTRARARRVIAVAPSFFGARQDRQTEPRESVSADLNLDLIQTAGANHFVTVNIHDLHTLNAVRKPNVFDHLTAQLMLRAKLGELMTGDPDKYKLVTPDEGHTKNYRKDSLALGIGLKDMVKVRPSGKEAVQHVGRVEGVDGLTCFVVDDMIGTGGTLMSAVETLKSSGVGKIYVAVTHPYFSDPKIAKQIGKEDAIKRIFVADTVPIKRYVSKSLDDKLEVVSCAELLANGLWQILTRGSVSELYGGENFS